MNAVFLFLFEGGVNGDMTIRSWTLGSHVDRKWSSGGVIRMGGAGLRRGARG